MIKQLFILITILVSAQVSGQTNDELREIFTKAESHYLFEEYELANPLYLMLNDFMPDNANIKYKIGNCYLNIDDEKPKAISFLEAAVKNSSYEAKEESFKEERAPLDVFFSLATAYQINNEFDKALSSYARLNKLMPEKGKLENSDYIDQQINACRNAIKAVENPIEFKKENLGPLINLGSINSHPVVSGDGNTLIFTEQRGLENTLYYVRRERGSWREPIDITSQLGDARDCTSSSLNFDGTVLFLYKNDNYVGNIYTSTYENGSWSKIRKLGRNINTRFYESHASVSKDGTKLYFTSNRDGGEGALDIYVSLLDEKGEWGEAENLGSAINTPYNEDTPFITTNDSILYFSSEGHSNIGGYDIFESKLLGGIWKSPRNVGYPLNTADNDLFYQPYNNGRNAYYSLVTGYKERHIHYITPGDRESEERLFEIKGIISLSDTVIGFNDDFKIFLYSKTSEDTLDISYPNKSTGFYSFLVKGDEYTISYTGIGYLSSIKEVALYEDHPTDEEIIDVILEPDENYFPIPEIIEQLDFSQVQVVEAIDSSILITNIIVRDISDSDSTNIDILYYTVQLMALHNPVDVTFFKYTDVTVIYNDSDRFYRYTTGRFETKEKAYERRDELINIGYPEGIFIKAVFRGNQE